MYKIKPKYADTCNFKMIDDTRHVLIQFIIKESVYNHELVKPIIDELNQIPILQSQDDFIYISIYVPDYTLFRLEKAEYDNFSSIKYIETEDKSLKRLNFISLFALSRNFVSE